MLKLKVSFVLSTCGSRHELRQGKAGRTGESEITNCTHQDGLNCTL